LLLILFIFILFFILLYVVIVFGFKLKDFYSLLFYLKKNNYNNKLMKKFNVNKIETKFMNYINFLYWKMFYCS
jgi:hypothetical protein